ncbi:MAG: sulfurtransferase [Saprospiraceae bacterium]|nr:sulfurtransferase [Saprospiraceae bacterium]
MSYTTIISPFDLHALLGKGTVRILDCRFSLADTEWGRNAYRAAHLPGAVYAHLDDDLSAPVVPGVTGRHPLPAPEAFAARLGVWGISGNDQVVVYDQSHGGLAARAWWMLHWMGHEDCALLDGGWAAWTAQQYPVTDDVPSPTATQYRPRVNAAMTVSADIVNAWRQDAAHCVIDARAAARYRGEVEPIDPVAGHMPGAFNLPFMENVHPDGSWKSPEVLRARLSKITVPDHQIAVHCGSGVTACHDILAFKHAGLGMPKLYPGSWSEWITDPSRPVTTGPA